MFHSHVSQVVASRATNVYVYVYVYVYVFLCFVARNR